tara:strand:- start:3196 stop:3639 length:444 start_codon:yes stop_codon:yes gene_type:complete
MSLLRRTVVKAFSAPAGMSHSAVEPGAPREHSEALGRFFGSLGRAFEARGCEPTRGGRAGVEFRVETPGGAVFFRNGLHGMVSVRRLVDEERGAVVELLGVQRLRDEYIPIRKAVADEPGRVNTRARGAGFSYTSVNELVEEYMEGN